jgi:hypothetical protein
MSTLDTVGKAPQTSETNANGKQGVKPTTIDKFRFTGTPTTELLALFEYAKAKKDHQTIADIEFQLDFRIKFGANYQSILNRMYIEEINKPSNRGAKSVFSEVPFTL